MALSMGTYRRDRSYAWNYANGPCFGGPFPEVPDVPEKDFLGFRVRSRIGVAAGLLLNSTWIECYARLGFDLLTYKTVRSAARPSYPLPNWVLVDAPGGIDVRRDQVLRVREGRWRGGASGTSAVCFGMPSMAPEVWRRDIQEAKRRIGRGQILIVSVVGTPTGEGGADALIEDFARCATWAAAAGADVVEANLSCPNVCTAEGSIYEDAPLARRVALALRDALPSTPLLVKIGLLGSREAIATLYEALGTAVDGVVLVNGIARRVVREDGRPAFGRFERVGVLGAAIHAAAVTTVERATLVSREAKLPTATLAVGGITTDDDPLDFFAAGAAGVLLGSAPMFDPGIAARMKARHPEW